MTASSAVIAHLAERRKCFYCKGRFADPLLLPIPEAERRPGRLQPRFNPEALFHFSDTHGYPKELMVEWLIDAVYGRGTVLQLNLEVESL